MGAYLYYKTTEKEIEKVFDYLVNQNELNGKLFDEWDEQMITIGSQENVDWAKKERPDLIDMMKKGIGKGNIKTSGGTSEKFEEAGYDENDLLEMWTMIFEQLNERFGMKYYANSCAFNEDENYFSLEQMKRITQNAKLLSGKTSSSERGRKLYDKYYAMLSEPEKEIFDISIVRVKDELLLDDGNYYKVEDRWGDLKLTFLSANSKYNHKKIKDIVDSIQGYKKYIPRIRYDGATADMESYILNGNELIYLELIGQESKVKSISSVLMQGRVKMNDTSVNSTEFSFFSINKAGNKRKMIPLEDGLAHAIIYHSPSIADTDFSVLIGRDNEELISSFSAWLENSQPLPYPKELVKEIYQELQNREKLTELKSFNIEAIKVDLSILEDEYSDLADIILKVCRDNGLIDPNAIPLKQQFPLPKSPVLQKKQVQKIWNTLNSMPKTYELEDVDIKPIGLKLFSPNMTLYITEADAGCEDDEFENMHTQCYGYVKNESEQIGEWGYINVPQYIKAGSGLNYFEQDLYFEDMYINSKGKVGKIDDFKEAA